MALPFALLNIMRSPGLMVTPVVGLRDWQVISNVTASPAAVMLPPGQLVELIVSLLIASVLSAYITVIMSVKLFGFDGFPVTASGAVISGPSAEPGSMAGRTKLHCGKVSVPVSVGRFGGRSTLQVPALFGLFGIGMPPVGMPVPARIKSC